MTICLKTDCIALFLPVPTSVRAMSPNSCRLLGHQQQDDPWKQMISAISGVGLSGYWLVRTTNTVRQLVLRKGGKHLTVVTYGILGRSSKFTTIPLNHVSILHTIRKFLHHLRRHENIQILKINVFTK